ncbi:MAG: ATP-binding protein [Leptolyngbyaceae cyanobacterium bins.59]|nr:ATP-binding protein [Leptolyngbyaceae cyanobacterium bins.59]
MHTFLRTFPVPLKFSVPLILLLMGGLAGLLSFHQQVSVAHQRMEEEVERQARFTGGQTSAVLEYMFRTTPTREGSQEGANLVISQMGGDPDLELAFLCDEQNRILLATRYELRNQLVTPNLLTLPDLSQLDAVRQSRSGQIFYLKHNHHLKAIYPVLLTTQGEIRSSKVGLMVLVYNLSRREQQAYRDALLRSLEITGMIALLCVLVWLFFEKTVTRRANRLVVASNQLAKGNLTARTQLAGSDEIAQISVAFDRMAEQLEGDITDRKQAEAELKKTLQELQKTQTQLIQTEKMSSLGQLVAGVAHEINNPVNFIYGNLTHASDYAQDLMDLVQLYQEQYPQPTKPLQSKIRAIELGYILEDFPKMLASMKVGADRIRQIVLSLRNFSRLDESDMKQVDLHEGIDSTLLILQSRLKPRAEWPGIQIERDYGKIPPVECYAGQLNQVFMNILVNAIDALEETYDSSSNLSKHLSSVNRPRPMITIRTQMVGPDQVRVSIVDNGPGMSEDVRSRLFDPFFTTKPVGKGTGLGLAISYQIVFEKHQGTLDCQSSPSKGTEFQITVPIYQRVAVVPCEQSLLSPPGL